MTTRENVMKALTFRDWEKFSVIGAARFGWYGVSGEYIGHRVVSGWDVTELKSKEEVESCVASMIAARPSVARVL